MCGWPRTGATLAAAGARCPPVVAGHQAPESGLARTCNTRTVGRRGHVRTQGMRACCNIWNVHISRENGREGLGTEGRGRTTSEGRKPWPQELGAGRVDRVPFVDRTWTDLGGRMEAKIDGDQRWGLMAIDSARKIGRLA